MIPGASPGDEVSSGVWFRGSFKGVYRDPLKGAIGFRCLGVSGFRGLGFRV